MRQSFRGSMVKHEKKYQMKKTKALKYKNVMAQCFPWTNIKWMKLHVQPMVDRKQPDKTVLFVRMNKL